VSTGYRHDQVEELLGAYALDALEAAEHAFVEAHLPTCARCRAEVEEFREVAALLAHTGAPAPPGLWDRIAASLEGEAPGGALADKLSMLPMGSGERSRQTWRNRMGAAVLAAAAVVIVVLGVQLADQDRRLDEMAGLLERDALERAYQAAETSPGAEVIQLASFDGAVTTRAVVTDDGEGYLWAADLPALDEGRTYQLWGDMGDRLISLGLMGRDPEVVPFAASEALVAVAITQEEEPGVVATDQPILAHGLLPQ
jgi:anti-sigma-K factor RskA